MTYAYDAANQLTSMNAGGSAATFAYDPLGQMTTWTQNGVTTKYTYAMWGLLSKVDIGNDGTPEVTYRYGGDGSLRERETASGDYSWYSGLSEFNASGAMVRTFVDNAVVEGANPATGTWAYALNDLYGSPRRICDQNRTTLRTSEFTPYGLPYSGVATGAAGGFTGHSLDEVSGFYGTAYRQYSPVLARWISREPSGTDGPNLYWYGLSSPDSYVDFDGQSARSAGPSTIDWLIDGVGGCLAGMPDNKTHVVAWGISSITRPLAKTRVAKGLAKVGYGDLAKAILKNLERPGQSPTTNTARIMHMLRYPGNTKVGAAGRLLGRVAKAGPVLFWGSAAWSIGHIIYCGYKSW